jgi:hypothetical protein
MIPYKGFEGALVVIALMLVAGGFALGLLYRWLFS